MKNQKLKCPLAYLTKTRNANWYWMVLTVACLAIISMSITINFPPWFCLRVLLGLALVFWLPGYCVTRLLLPKHSKLAADNEIDRIERIALSIGLSIALASIVGLFLRFTPWSSDYQIALSLADLSVILATIAWVNDGKVAPINKNGS